VSARHLVHAGDKNCNCLVMADVIETNLTDHDLRVDVCVSVFRFAYDFAVLCSR
jgi:hypothetical protein